MIFGESRDLREVITSGGDPFVITATSLAVYDGSGALIDSGTPTEEAATDLTSWTLSRAFTPPAAGFYVAVFEATIGEEVRRFIQTVTVDPVVARFSYDEAALAQGTGTAAGRLALTRLLLSDAIDTTTQPAIYTDAEIRAYLALAAQDPYEAAAQAYEGMAASRGRIAQVMSQQGITVHRHALQHLTAMAQTMRNRKLQGALHTGSIEHGSPGELLDGYRREWSDFADVPEVR